MIWIQKYILIKDTPLYMKNRENDQLNTALSIALLLLWFAFYFSEYIKLQQ